MFVKKDNPIQALSVAQVDGIFSKSRRSGYKEDIRTWGQLGLTGEWASRPLSLYGRNSASGTYGYFKEHALCDGDFKPTINEQPGSASVVQGVSETPNAIGYSGIGYITSGVKAVPLARAEGEAYAPADAEHAIDGSYPLARLLYVYVNRHPEDGLPPLEREFLKMVLSKQGQEVVVRDGYIPLPANYAARVRQELGF